MFHCKNLCVSIGDTAILTNLSLSLAPGSVHAIMGPNGSGKSTLAHTVAGNPLYTVTNGTLWFDGENITNLSPDKRARRGLFLSFQQPLAIPGLQVFSFLKEAYRAISKKEFDADLFEKQLASYCALLQMDTSFLYRNCNDGFSGGERKRFELLQLLVLRPQFVILDEIDSGLDVDALGLVARVIALLKKENPRSMFLIITHYKRVLEYVVPNYVHILCEGRLVDSGDASLIHVVDQKGYDAYKHNAQ